MRRSDIFTRNGNNQFMVLLSEMDNGSDEPIMKRVLDAWEEEGKELGAAISYETAVIRK